MEDLLADLLEDLLDDLNAVLFKTILLILFSDLLIGASHQCVDEGNRRQVDDNKSGDKSPQSKFACLDLSGTGQVTVGVGGF